MDLWSRQWEFLSVWAGAMAALYLFSNCWLVSLVSTSLLALLLADVILKSYDIFIVQRQTISTVRNKAVLITGCDTGFGFQLSERLSEIGFKVFACCLFADSDGAKALAKHEGITVVKMDVTSQEDVDHAFETIESALKKYDLQLWSIVNNAGIAVVGEVEFVNVSQYRKCLEVNTFGPLMVTKGFLPLLRAAGRGRVVNVASQLGRHTSVGFSPYAMTKHALVSFSDGLRLEMKKWNISVHTIEPVLYRTDITNFERIRSTSLQMWDEASAELKAAYGQQYYEAFLANFQAIIDTARPADKAYEVVDDIVDAVAGTDPKIRYVPSIIGKVVGRLLLRDMPVEIIDKFWLRFTTKVPLLAATANQTPATAN